jgi:hypothetical protein
MQQAPLHATSSPTPQATNAACTLQCTWLYNKTGASTALQVASTLTMTSHSVRQQGLPVGNVRHGPPGDPHGHLYVQNKPCKAVTPCWWPLPVGLLSL